MIEPTPVFFWGELRRRPVRLNTKSLPNRACSGVWWLAMRRLTLLIVLASTFAPAQNPPEIPPQLTLSQALNMALTNSTVLREAQARFDQASGKYLEYRSPLIPQLNIRAHQSYLTINLLGLGLSIPGVTTGIIGPFASMDARAILTWDLLNISNFRSWDSYRSRKDSSRSFVDDAREVVTLNVVSAYLEALSAKASRDTLSEQKKLADDLYQLTRDRVTQGVAAELDANRAMQQVNTLEQKRQEAEQDYVAAKLNLANILQAHVTSNFEVADEAAYGSAVDQATSDRDTAVKTALASRPDYRALEQDVKAAELEVRSIKSTRLPSVKLTATDGQSGSTPVHNGNTYSVAGSIEFPIFTGGNIRGQIQDAEGALREARTALDKNRSQVETDVLTAISGVEWGLKEVETSAGNVTLSRQEVDLARQRFTQGITDNTEVVNAQDRLAQADNAGIRAHYTLGLARANVARAIGAAEKTYRK